MGISTKVAKRIWQHRTLARQVKAGRMMVTYINLPEPKDYTEAFDRAIKMVEWQIGEEVTLSERDFQRYVLNDWEWGQQFAAATASYVGS